MATGRLHKQLGPRQMTENDPISRESFDETATRFGIAGSEAHMDELFRQVQVVLRGNESLLGINVDGVEPDMAFRPTGSRQD